MTKAKSMSREAPSNKHLTKRIITLFLLFAVILSGIVAPVMQPVRAEAFTYSTVYIQLSIDTTNWQMVGGVVSSKNSQFVSDNRFTDEQQRVGEASLKKLAQNTGILSHSGGMLAGFDATSISSGRANGALAMTEYLVLTFPGALDNSGFAFAKKSSTYDDQARAQTVMGALLYDLNAAFSFVNGGKYVPTGNNFDEQLSRYKDDIAAFLNAIQFSGNVVTGGSINLGSGTYVITPAKPEDVPKPFDKTSNYTDYICIHPQGFEGSKEIFQFRIPKGYQNVDANVSSSDENSPLYRQLPVRNLYAHSNNDAAFLNWGIFAFEAFSNITLEDKYIVTSENVYITEPTAFEKTIVDLLQNVCGFIEGVLGLWSLDDLVFNAGIRGGKTYVGGIFPASWEPTIWALFTVMEIMAILMIALVILKSINQKAMSTSNPILRFQASEQIKNVFIIIIGIGAIPVLLNLIIGFSSGLTGVFSDMIGNVSANERLKVFSASGGSLGAVIMQIMYLGILIYFNFFYILRGITVALLIVLSPIYITAIAFGNGSKKMATTCLKELFANVFIQAIHAFLLGFILVLPTSGRPMESIVSLFAIIGASNLLRGIFFGQSGSMLHQMAEQGKKQTLKTGSAVAFGVAGGVISGVTDGDWSRQLKQERG